MGAHGGPKVVSDNLRFMMDVADNRCVSPMGTSQWNTAPQAFKNLVDLAQTANVNNNARLGNLSVYTAFCIDYPESSYGGSAAGRDGITPGNNVLTGTKTFEYSRSRHFHIWSGNSFIANSNFNGSSGFIYDCWSGNSTNGGGHTAQNAQFVSDYNSLSSSYNDINDTWIVAGSHRDSSHTNDYEDVLRDMGAPQNIDSILDGAPEYIVVGRPGLGAGNAFGYAFENYATDPERVAHMNIALPAGIHTTKGYNTDNYIGFNPSDSDNIVFTGNVGTANHSTEAWFYLSSTGNQNILFNTNGQGLYPRLMYHSGAIKIQYSQGSTQLITGPSLSTNEWYHACFTYNAATGGKFYIDSALVGVDGSTGNLSGTGVTHNMTIGYDSNLDDYLNGRVADVRIYTRALTRQEVYNNYTAKKRRFNKT